MQYGSAAGDQNRRLPLLLVIDVRGAAMELKQGSQTQIVWGPLL